MKRKRGSTGWVVYWGFGEDEVEKRTGTVLCLLPRRYGRSTVQQIIEALYISYVYKHSGQLEYACSNPRHKIEIESNSVRVIIAEKPSLIAVLADDIRIERRGETQTVLWTDPDVYTGRDAQLQVHHGAKRRYTFDFWDYKQLSD